jgi:hypothetical protein
MVIGSNVHTKVFVRPLCLSAFVVRFVRRRLEYLTSGPTGHPRPHTSAQAGPEPERHSGSEARPGGALPGPFALGRYPKPARCAPVSPLLPGVAEHARMWDAR